MGQGEDADDALSCCRSQLTGELKDGIPHVLTTLNSYFFMDNNIELQQKAMKCLQTWIIYGIELEYVCHSNDRDTLKNHCIYLSIRIETPIIYYKK
jgi:hypothetical protein